MAVECIKAGFTVQRDRLVYTEGRLEIQVWHFDYHHFFSDWPVVGDGGNQGIWVEPLSNSKSLVIFFHMSWPGLKPGQW